MLEGLAADASGRGHVHQVGREADQRLPGPAARCAHPVSGAAIRAIRAPRYVVSPGAGATSSTLVAGVDEMVRDLPGTVVVVPSTAG